MRGLYSVQALPVDPEGVDITIYRDTAKEAVAWKDAQAKTGKYRKFLLRHAVSAWDVYDGSGKLEYLCNDVVDEYRNENTKEFKIDRQAFIDKARAHIGNDYTCVVVLEAQQNACAADHSNFVIMSQIMLLQGLAEDKKHICVVESQDWGCRVIGLFMDVAKLSEAAIDKFLDRYCHLSKSWPLSGSHHLEVLSSRLSTIRRDYLVDVVGSVMPDEEASIAAKFNMLSASDDKLKVLAQKVVSTLSYALEISAPGAPEVFDEDCVIEKRRELQSAYLELFCP